MRLPIILILLLASLTPAHAHAETQHIASLYVLGWASPLPVQIARVQVTGGALVQVLASGDGMSGTIAASAERDCVAITAEGTTTTGAGVRFVHAWDVGCWRAWLPFSAAGG